MDRANPLQRMLDALEGLSVGDAFGERFFQRAELVESMLRTRSTVRPPWRYTDDTVMAMGIVQVLASRGRVEQDELAEVFARLYQMDRDRGYGGVAQIILQKIIVGIPWREAAAEPFEGEGSMGNGAAMRVAPLGAFFADDDDARVAAEATASAAVTHAHPDGQAGAVAVASAAAWAARSRGLPAEATQFFRHVLAHVPDGPTRARLHDAAALPLGMDPRDAARRLGSGQRVLSHDTVPFALWCVARHLDSFGECLWSTVSGLGDRDTTCAIAGGVLASRLGAGAIPPDWRAAREPLPIRIG